MSESGACIHPGSLPLNSQKSVFESKSGRAYVIDNEGDEKVIAGEIQLYGTATALLQRFEGPKIVTQVCNCFNPDAFICLLHALCPYFCDPHCNSMLLPF